MSSGRVWGQDWLWVFKGEGIEFNIDYILRTSLHKGWRLVFLTQASLQTGPSAAHRVITRIRVPNSSYYSSTECSLRIPSLLFSPHPTYVS